MNWVREKSWLLAFSLFLVCHASRLSALEVLRLPWIFSDEPELSADFNFSPSLKGKTLVDFSLGGRFSKFGLPFGAARAPILDIRVDFINPGELVSSVATLHGHLDLGQVLKDYGKNFSPDCFSDNAPYVFKSDFQVELAPGDYNVVVAIEDKELSIASNRTLHIIVPSIRDEDGISDLRFCLGVGEKLNALGKIERLLDINPWRQVGGSSQWDLIVAYKTLGAFARNGLRRRHSIWHLRGDTENPLWVEEGAAPPKKAEQVYLAQLPLKELHKFEAGIYVFKVEYWDPKSPDRVATASKTFEILP